MKPRMNLLLTAIIFSLLTASAWAGQPLPGSHQAAKEPQKRVKKHITIQFLPDVTPHLDVTVSKTGTDGQGNTCYTIQPSFSVLNRGVVPADNFRVKLTGRVFRPGEEEITWESPLVTLNPGSTKQWGPDQQWKIHCCVNRFQKENKMVGIQVLADSRDSLKESNEHNNLDRKRIDIHWYHGPIIH